MKNLKFQFFSLVPEQYLAMLQVLYIKLNAKIWCEERNTCKLPQLLCMMNVQWNSSKTSASNPHPLNFHWLNYPTSWESKDSKHLSKMNSSMYKKVTSKYHILERAVGRRPQTTNNFPSSKIKLRHDCMLLLYLRCPTAYKVRSGTIHIIIEIISSYSLQQHGSLSTEKQN